MLTDGACGMGGEEKKSEQGRGQGEKKWAGLAIGRWTEQFSERDRPAF